MVLCTKKKQSLVNKSLHGDFAIPSFDLVTNQPETYDQLLPKLSPAMRKMYQSRKTQEKEPKTDEWFSSLQYLNANINDLTISNSFLDMVQMA